MKAKILVIFSTVLLMGIFGMSSGSGEKGEFQTLVDFVVEPGKNMNISEVSSASFEGEMDFSYTGISLTYAGDINGDGLDDVVIPASGNSEGNTSAGKVYIVFGKYGGWNGLFNLSNADASYLGEGIYDAVGTTLAGLGDINGDGFDDLAIGSPGNDQGGAAAGKIYIIFGKDTGWEKNVDLSSADASIRGSDYSYFFGTSLSTAGDVDGDGLSDFIVGSYKTKAFLFYGNNTGWHNDMTIADADTVFVGETAYDYLGDGVSGGGDLNNDGYSDILIGATRSSDGGSYAGKLHIFFGKPEGFEKEVSASTSDASLLGEGTMNMTGKVSYNRGDVNSDGYDDILVSSTTYGVGGYGTGKAYLVLGKQSGWHSGISLSNADASWIGERASDYAGTSLSFVGDHNSDGYDDIMIGSPNSGVGDLRTGKAYLIYGRQSGWEKNISLSEVPQSLVGESNYDNLGKAIAGVGDPDGDGAVNVLVSGYLNDDGGYSRGKVYQLNSLRTYDPDVVYSVMIYDDPFYTNVPTYLEKGQTFYVQLTGQDGNSTNTDNTRVNVTFEWNSVLRIPLNLRETGPDTGIYRSQFIVPSNSEYKNKITLVSTVDESKTANVMVHTPILLMPQVDVLDAIQDEEYYADYWNFGYENDQQWKMATEADWLSFYPTTGDIRGTPGNEHVGKWTVRIELSDGNGHMDARDFEITVKNKDPTILTVDITTVIQDEYYYVDYDSNEGGSGMTTWHFVSQANWLTLNPETGEIFGTPTNEDVDSYTINVWVDDGNEGTDSRDFTLIVVNVNDPPTIVTPDVKELDQGDNFRRDYDVEDIDLGDEHTWSLETNAAWLSLDPDTGVIRGKPGPLDVGSYNVEVKVTDSGGLFDSHEFVLVVNNINDPPELTDIPHNIDVEHGDLFRFDVNGTDIDGEEGLIYSVSTVPNSDMTINPQTGLVQWRASIDWFIGKNSRLKVKVALSDGEFKDQYEFEITVKPSAPPSAMLLTPDDEAKISKVTALLSWSGYDLEGDPLTYDVYVGETKAFVQTLKEECLYVEDYAGTDMGLEGLETGKTYFWIVIPYDGCSYGTSSTGVHSFILNNPPKVEEVGMQEVIAGEKFKLLLRSSDEDDDKGDLRYQLIEGPDGLELDESTGMIKWTPGKEDIMLHHAQISITDGMDSTVFEVVIDVVEPNGGDGGGNGIMIGAIAGTAGLVILVGAGIGAFIWKKKREDEDDEEEVTLETAFQNDESEDDDISVMSRYSSVSISANEAHLADKVQHKMSYENLYGKSKPKAEEKGMTTRELKKFIGQQITELENLEE